MPDANISGADVGSRAAAKSAKRPSTERDGLDGPERRHAAPRSRHSASVPVNLTADRAPRDRIKALYAIRDRHRSEASATQTERLLEALQTLQHVTTFEASRYLDLYDPRARKLNLVKAGHNILTTWRTVQTESGLRHRIGVYSLVRGAA